MKRFLAALVLFLCPSAVLADLECRDTEYEGNEYAICVVDVATSELRLFLNDKQGKPYRHFSTLDAAQETNGMRLAFAMNAGMYHEDRSPVGLYVENGVEYKSLVPGAGPGNFGLVPNGIFCINDARADVIETQNYLQTRPTCRFATQSGPMLVINGALHPRFLDNSTSRYVRNGVGTTNDGRFAVFAISRQRVTFHTFARLFRDALGLHSALYLDGNISKLHARELGRSDFGRAMGPIVGVLEPKD